MEINTDTLQGMLIAVGFLGTCIGAIMSMIVSKLPLFKRNGKNNKHVHSAQLDKLEKLELCDETGGTMHISKESLSKYRTLEKKINEDYLTEKAHTLICAKERAEMREHITNEIGSATDKIIGAIQANGK